MKSFTKTTILLVLTCILAATMFVGCSNDKRGYAYKAAIPNAGFERGDLSGWTVTGDAFSVEESANKSLGQDGRFYVKSSKEGKGELTSAKFTLKDTGYVSFLIGAGEGDCYVAVYADDVLVKEISNPYFEAQKDDVMRRVLVNLTNYVGQQIYFKIVDNSSDMVYSYINVDAFDVNVTVTDKAVYKTAKEV